MNLAQLRAAALARREEARALLVAATADGGRDLNETETAAFDSAMADVTRIEANIARVTSLDAADARASTILPAAARGQGPSDVVHAQGEPAKREFENLGHFMRAVRFNPNDERLADLYNDEAGAAAAASMTPEQRAEMRMDVGASGGFAIPPAFRETLLEITLPGESPIRSGATVIAPDAAHPDAGITMPVIDQTGTADGHQFGGVTVGWVEEGGQKPLTDMELGQVTVETHEVAGYMIVTDKLLRNWQGADPLIRRQFRNAMLQSGEYAFLRGNGTGKPQGIIGHGSTIIVNRETVGTVTIRDLVSMVARLIGTDGVWLMPKSVLPAIAMLKDDNGNFIWLANARDGFAGTLLGFPVKWSAISPALGTSGDIMLVDASYYLIKDGSGPFVAASEHVLFTQNKTVIKAFWNVGGKPWLTAPHADAGGYLLSPFVQLGPKAV